MTLWSRKLNVTPFSQVFLLIEICGEIDINIEESTSLIYEDELEQALVHIQIAHKKLTVRFR